MTPVIGADAPVPIGTLATVTPSHVRFAPTLTIHWVAGEKVGVRSVQSQVTFLFGLIEFVIAILGNGSENVARTRFAVPVWHNKSTAVVSRQAVLTVASPSVEQALAARASHFVTASE